MTSSANLPTEFPRQTRSASPLLSWSPEQLTRLQVEWRLLQRSLAYHPYLRLVSMQDDPPDEYQIEFRVNTLCVGDSGELEYLDVVPMRVLLSTSFPSEPPSVRPLKALFHPNISWDGIHVSSSWQPGDTLVAFLQQVGELLAFRAYDPDTIVNAAALDWMQSNADLLPLDGTADFSPNAGGQPLERICQQGQSTLDEVRTEIDAARNTLLDPDLAPGPSEARAFSRHTRQALSLFADADIPERLADEARRLDEWARDLPASLPVWEFLREQRAAAQSVREACGDLSEKQEPLIRQTNSLDALAPAANLIEAEAALAAIPPRQAMDLIRLKLPHLVREADELLKTLQQGIQELDSLSTAVPTLNDSGLLARQLQTEVEAAAAATRSARVAATGILATIEPLLHRSREGAITLELIGRWREYLDLLATGNALEQKLGNLGAAGVQAFYLENAAGEFGPFQFDEPVDLGVMRIAVRSTAPNRVRLINVETNNVIGRSDTGLLTIKLVASGAEAGELHTFRLSERWEDFAVQFDFLVRETEQAIAQLTASPVHGESWCARLLDVLHRPDSLHLLRERQRKFSQLGRSLLLDLQALGPVKARIETWNLVTRIGEIVPVFIRRLSEQRAILQKSVASLAPIVARCTRDLDTDQLIVPPKLVQAYSNNIELRDHAHQEIARLEALLSQAGSQVAGQLASRSQIGTQGVPTFHWLAPFPPDLEERVAGMTDHAIAEQVNQLESMLNKQLRGEAFSPVPAGSSAQPEPPQAVPPPAQEEVDAQSPPADVAQTEDVSEAALLSEWAQDPSDK